MRKTTLFLIIAMTITACRVKTEPSIDVPNDAPVIKREIKETTSIKQTDYSYVDLLQEDIYKTPVKKEMAKTEEVKETIDENVPVSQTATVSQPVQTPTPVEQPSEQPVASQPIVEQWIPELYGEMVTENIPVYNSVKKEYDMQGRDITNLTPEQMRELGVGCSHVIFEDELDHYETNTYEKVFYRERNSVTGEIRNVRVATDAEYYKYFGY